MALASCPVRQGQQRSLRTPPSRCSTACSPPTGRQHSYLHAYAVIRAHGESGVTARLEPATIDGLVYASSMVILYAARNGNRAPGLARWLLGLGIAATLAANLTQGWSHGPAGAAVAAWPAVSLVGSYELLVWLIGPAGIPKEQLCHHAACHAAVLPDTLTAVSNNHPGRGTAEIKLDDDVNDAAVAAYRLSVQADSPLSERKLAQMFGRTSRRWARARMTEARQVPHYQDSPRPPAVTA
jgi:uncharacterized protein DUF2637